MRNKEYASYLYRAIINNLDGNFDEFERLTKLAMKHNDEMTCECGGIKIPCKYYYGRKKYKRGFICTDCGQVIDQEGKIIKKGRDICSH